MKNKIVLHNKNFNLKIILIKDLDKKFLNYIIDN